MYRQEYFDDQGYQFGGDGEGNPARGRGQRGGRRWNNQNRGNYGFRGAGRGQQFQQQQFQPRGRGNQGGFRGRGRGQQANVPNNNSAHAGGQSSGNKGPPPPTGKFGAKENSGLKVDKINDEAFMPEPNAELRDVPKQHYVHTGADGLDELVHRVFTLLKAKNPGFARRIPESAFGYYCAVATWCRMLYVHELNGGFITYDESNFVRALQANLLKLPKPIATFVNSIGNATLPGSGDVKFRLKEHEYERAAGITGWFGQVNELTHWLYASYPCLAVYVRRMQRDLDAVEIGPWNLPPGINPGIAAAGNPTRNMLGWAPTVDLRQDAVHFLNENGVEEAMFRSENGSLPINYDLLASIRDELTSSRGFDMLDMEFDSAGSAGVLITEKVFRDNLYAPFSMNILKETELFVESPLKIDAKAAYGGGTFLYRLWKDAIIGTDDVERRSWCVYEFGDFINVPDEWHDTRNQLHTDEPEIMNQVMQNSVAFRVITRLVRICDGMSSKT